MNESSYNKRNNDLIRETKEPKRLHGVFFKQGVATDSNIEATFFKDLFHGHEVLNSWQLLYFKISETEKSVELDPCA